MSGFSTSAHRTLASLHWFQRLMVNTVTIDRGISITLYLCQHTIRLDLKHSIGRFTSYVASVNPPPSHFWINLAASEHPVAQNPKSASARTSRRSGLRVGSCELTKLSTRANVADAPRVVEIRTRTGFQARKVLLLRGTKQGHTDPNFTTSIRWAAKGPRFAHTILRRWIGKHPHSPRLSEVFCS